MGGEYTYLNLVKLLRLNLTSASLTSVFITSTLMFLSSY
jgi:hypothetical protein